MSESTNTTSCYTCHLHKIRDSPPCSAHPKNTKVIVDQEQGVGRAIHDELLTTAEILNRLANTCLSLAELVELNPPEQTA